MTISKTGPQKKQEITAVVKNVTYKNTDNGYMILKTETGITLCGVYYDAGVDLQGVQIKAVGEWQKHKTYGMQFIFDELIILENELFYFLTKVIKGLGKKLATLLIDSMGEEKLEHILDTDPNQLLEVKGIKEKKLKKIVGNWQRYRDLKELSKFLVPLGATHTFVQKVYREFEQDRNIIQNVKDNPYILTAIKGVGFKTADKIGRTMGIEPTDHNRIESCIEYVLFNYTDSNGNSCIAEPLLLNLANEELVSGEDDFKIEPELFRDILKTMGEKEKIEFLKDEKLTSSFLFNAESRIYKAMVERSEGTFPPLFSDIEAYIKEKEAGMGIQFSEDQQQALRIINKGQKVFVLCGYAGTGKSTIARAILGLFRTRYAADKIMCCAVSGIASDRIRKTSGYQAQTIYSLIYKHSGEGKEFPYDVLLVDEASMVNTELLYKLILRLKSSSTLIMVGDPAQLPPIGAGEPFSDIIELNLAPSVSLTRIYRQSEDKVIAVFANEIREAHIPEGYQSGQYSDFDFVDLSIPNYFSVRAKVKKNEMPENEFKAMKEKNTVKIFDAIMNISESYKPLLTEALKQKNFAEFLTTFQIITPMKGGVLGTENLNDELQKLLNQFAFHESKSVELGTTRLALSDKVVHIQNTNIDCISPANYRKQERQQYFYKERIYNGMIGIIIAVDKEEEVLHVFYPADRTIVEYSFNEARDFLRLGYALTIHKVQGSEFKHVLLPMTFSHFIMLNSKLLYTAITRAREKIILVGEDYAFKAASRKKEATMRDTVLKLLEGKDLKGGTRDSLFAASG
jgi:exodeoxyribonuclease V alpha subunit